MPNYNGDKLKKQPLTKVITRDNRRLKKLKKKVEKKINSKPFYINFGINKTYYTKAFINSNYLYFTFVS